MKQLVQFKRIFAAVLLLTVSTISWADGTEINGIYYVLDSSSKTASVTFTGTGTNYYSYNPSSTAYTGSITIPSTVTYNSTTYSVNSIGGYAFSNCTGLTSVTIPESVTSIGSSAFYGCRGLTSVTIPNSVTSIGSSAFYYCSGLTSVTIPNSVTSIGSSAFSGCSGLTSVTIPNSVTSIGDKAFYNCSGLTSVTLNANDIVSKTYTSGSNLGTIFGSQVKEYVLGDDVKGIGSFAFYECSGLTSITIPNSVTSIGSEAFYGTAWYNNQPDGLMYAGKVAYEYKGTMPSGTHIALEEGTLGIAGGTFYGRSGLTSVTIPNSVTSIGDNAFSGCSGLTSVTIPNSVISIGEGAFNACYRIRSLTIPESVASIGYEAFGFCSGLKEVYCMNERVPTNTDSYAFVHSNIESAVLYIPESSINAYQSTAPWNKFGAVLPIMGGGMPTPEEFFYIGTVQPMLDNYKSLPGVRSTYTSIEDVGGSSVSVATGDRIYMLCPVKWGIARMVELEDNLKNTYNFIQEIDATSIPGYVVYKTEVWHTERDLVLNPTPMKIIYGEAYNFSQVRAARSYVSDNTANTIKTTTRNTSSIVYVKIPHNQNLRVSSIVDDDEDPLIVDLIGELTTNENWETEGYDTYIGHLRGFYSFGSYGREFKIYIESKIPTTDITLSQTSATLTSKGQTLQLSATVTPSDVTNKNVTWSSSNTNVATVDANGLVTAVATGSATITATTTDGSNVTANCMVTVDIADTISIDGIFYILNSSTQEATVTYTGIDGSQSSSYAGQINIPTTVTYNNVRYSVTSIGEYAFRNCSLLTSVIIPESVTSIGKKTFLKCKGLTSITIPNSIKNIGDDAFNGCSNLIDVYITDLTAWCGITFGAGVCTPFDYASNLFLNGHEIKELVIPDGVTCLNECVFSGCSGLTSVTIPNSVTSIGKNAFSGCSGLTSVTIPDGVISIDDRAFLECSGLKLVTIPNSVTSIGSMAFYNCNGLTSVTCLSKQVPEIYSDAFVCCNTENATLYVPESAIDNYKATAPWSGFGTILSIISATGITLNQTSATLASKGQTTQLSATVTPSNATNKSVTWSSSNTAVATVDANGLVTAVANGSATITVTTDDGSNKTATCTVAVNITIPVTGISLNRSSEILTSKGQTLQLSATVTPSNATNKSVTWTSSNTSVATVSSTGLVTAVSSGTATITATTADGSNKTATCTVTVDMPVSATGISLSQTSATLTSKGQTLQLSATITPSNATNKSVTWSSSNTSVATVSSTGLVTAVMNGSATITVKTTDGSNKTATCLVMVNTSNGIVIDGIFYILDSSTKEATVTYTGVDGSHVSSYAGHINIPSTVTYNNVRYSVTSIGEYAFNECVKLASVTIPETISNISSNAFNGCTGLTTVTINANEIVSKDYNPPTVNGGKNIGTLFGSQVKKFIIGNNVTSIGADAFRGCNLTSVTIGNNVTTIGMSAFRECTNLLSVTIPNSVTDINIYAFLGCWALKSVTIGKSVTTMSGYTFYECYNLTSITCQATNVPTTKGTSSKYFEGVPSSAILYVPASSIDAYRSTAPWSDFGTIESHYSKTPVHNVGELQSGQVYTAETRRAAWYVPEEGTQLLTTVYPTSVENNQYDSGQQFAFIKWNDNIYIYCVGEQKILNGITSNTPNNGVLVTEDCQPVTIKETGDTDYPFFFTFGDNYNINVGGGNQITIDQWTTFDDGNKVALRPVHGVMIDEDEMWRIIAYIEGNSVLENHYSQAPVQNVGELINDRQVYTAETRRAAWYIPAGNTQLETTEVPAFEYKNSSNRSQQFAFIKHKGQYYIYCVGERKILNGKTSNSPSRGVLVTEDCQPVTIRETGDSYYPLFFSYGENYNVNIGGGNQITIDHWSTIDDGNKVALRPVQGVVIDDKEMRRIIEYIDGYITGDSNGNGEVEIGDVTSVLILMATPEATGYNNKAADANGNGEIEIGDVTTILTIMAGN